MNIQKKTGTANVTACNRIPQYIAIHYTAGTKSTSGVASSTASYFSKTGVGASADFIVDDVNIVQYNPDPTRYYCWAVGGSKYAYTKGASLYGVAKNANCVSIEMCSSNNTGTVTSANDAHWYFTDAVINNTIELVKYLMNLYNIPASKVIRHYDVNGKPCPGVIGWNANTGDESKWNAFKARLTGSTTVTTSKPATVTPTTSTSTTTELYRIRKTWADSASQIGAYSSLDNAKAQCKVGYSVFDSKGNCVYSNAGTASSAPVQTSAPTATTAAYSKTQFIKDIQKAIGVTVDGIAGPKTLAATPTLSKTKNAKHAAVLPVQKYLNALGYNCGTPDGVAGTKFDTAVKAYQKAKGCTADGEITAKATTWKKLLGLA